MVKLDYKFYSQIQETEVKWLWFPYIPYGKITLLQGDPGDGKSMFILNIIALLTKGSEMPDGYKISECINTIYQSKEDNVSDTVKPRLIKADADCDRVAFIVDDDLSLSIDDSRIEETIKATSAKLLVIDPIQSFLPADADINGTGKMRKILSKLASVAENTGCAVVLIGHMNKSKTGKSIYKGLGSIDIMAVSRSVLMISRDEDNPAVRYMYPIKSSLAPEGDAIGFRFDIENYFEWIGPCDIGQICLNDEYTGKEETAELMLTALLEEDRSYTDIMERMQDAGISVRTLKRAKKNLGVTSYRKNDKWYWSLQKDENPDLLYLNDNG